VRRFIACRLATLIVLAASSMPALAAMVHHAGEWQTVINNAQPVIACFPTDAPLDRAYEMRALAKIKGAHCKLTDMTVGGNIARYTAQCTIGDIPMTQTGTITQTGPDAFLNRVHGHGGGMSMLTGKNMTLPDMDMVSVEHRLGTCKPGDRSIDDYN
jgi:hypothetical protein